MAYDPRNPYQFYKPAGPANPGVTVTSTGLPYNSKPYINITPQTSTSKPPTTTTTQSNPASGSSGPDWSNWTGMPQGWGEDWYQKNAWQWDQPTQSSQHWNGVKGWFSTPQQGENDLYGISQSLAGPNALDNAWGRLEGEFYQPGEAESFYRNNRDLMGRPSQIGDYYTNNRAGFEGPGMMEQKSGDLYGRAMQQGALAQNASAVTGEINSARNSQNFLDASMPQLMGPGFTENLAYNYSPERGYSEGLMQSGAGLEQLYSRLYETGSRRLGEEAAARGGFNSGASLRAAEELNKDLAADEIRQRIALADQADKYRMSERQFGLNVGTSADTSMRGRLGLGFQGAGQADTTALGRASATQDLYKSIEDQRQSGIRLGADVAKDTQAANLSRLMGGASVANMASSDEINRYNSSMNAANMAQAAGLNRRNSAISAAGQVGQLNLAQALGRGSLSERAQNLGLNRINTGAGIAGNVDQTEFQRLIGAQGAATTAQNTLQGRLQGNLTGAMGLAGAMANTYLQGMDPARREQFQAGLSQIEGLLRNGQISAEAADAQARELFASMGLAANAYDLYKNNPRAFSAPPTTSRPPGMPPIPTPTDKGDAGTLPLGHTKPRGPNGEIIY